MKEIDIVFRLVRGALDGTVPEVGQMDAHRWWRLFRLMQQNHVAAMTADTMAALEVPREVKIPWLAERDKAERWHRYQEEVQQEIVGIMKQHGIETLVLKGTHTAQYYPKPELREFGDLDLYFFDRHDEADKVAAEVLKVTVSNEAHHHSKYNYRGVTVESHYDFVNSHYPPSNRHYESLLKELVGTKESLSTFHFSLSTFEILFLLRHMAGHFAASRITLRDLVDWTLTCRAQHDKVDWNLVDKTIREFGMTEFAAALNSIASQRFGIQMPTLSYDHPATLSRIEKDIIYGSMDDCEGDGISRMVWKMRRWEALKWKRKMVYNDSNFRLWFASLTAHAAKPRSITHKM